MGIELDHTIEELLAEVRQRCVALPEVTERPTHGAPTWFVRNRRSFVKFIDPDNHPRLDLRHLALWAAAPPGARRELIGSTPDRFFDPPFGGSDWVGMRLDTEPGGLDWEEVREVITDAFRHVAPKTLVARLDIESGR